MGLINLVVLVDLVAQMDSADRMVDTSKGHIGPYWYFVDRRVRMDLEYPDIGPLSDLWPEYWLGQTADLDAFGTGLGLYIYKDITDPGYHIRSILTISYKLPV